MSANLSALKNQYAAKNFTHPGKGPGPFNFKKLFDWTSFFQDPVRNAAKSSENFGVLF